MRAKKIIYNLNGHGQLLLYSYPYSTYLFKFLEKRNFDARFHFTNQLGSLKDILHGAHYTRYEYILLQWYIIHNLKSNVSGTGLGSTASSLEGIEELGKAPTKADVLQCIALLVNMGHFPSTFAGSRAWLHLITTNRELKRGFKSGLETDEKAILEQMIENQDVYRIHYINAIFLLRRYYNSSSQTNIIDFSIKLLKDYIKREITSLKKVWSIYDVVKKISYLLLDASYAPVPFNLDLPSVISNLQMIFSELGNDDQIIIEAINKIDLVLQDSLYLSGNALLRTSMKTNELLNKFKKLPTDNFHKISFVRDLLEPRNDNSNMLSKIFNEYGDYKVTKMAWDKENCLEIEFGNISNYGTLFSFDNVEYETKLHIYCGKTLCSISVFNNPSQDLFKIIYSPNIKKCNIEKLKSLMKFVVSYMNFIKTHESYEYQNPYDLKNNQKLIKYILKALFGWNLNFTLEWEQLKNSNETPIFLGRGVRAIEKTLSEYMRRVKSNISEDKYNEMQVVFEKLNSIDYRGYVIVFLGSTKVWKESSTPIAEFDGLIFMPNSISGEFASIIEAKNMKNGHTAAKKQLGIRVKDNLLEGLDCEIQDIKTIGASANIRLAKT